MFPKIHIILVSTISIHFGAPSSLDNGLGFFVSFLNNLSIALSRLRLESITRIYFTAHHTLSEDLLIDKHTYVDSVGS
jgi:hypothetical protein